MGKEDSLGGRAEAKVLQAYEDQKRVRSVLLMCEMRPSGWMYRFYAFVCLASRLGVKDSRALTEAASAGRER